MTLRSGKNYKRITFKYTTDDNLIQETTIYPEIIQPKKQSIFKILMKLILFGLIIISLYHINENKDIIIRNSKDTLRVLNRQFVNKFIEPYLNKDKFCCKPSCEIVIKNNLINYADDTEFKNDNDVSKLRINKTEEINFNITQKLIELNENNNKNETINNDDSNKRKFIFDSIINYR